MDLSVAAFLGVLAAVALLRLVELLISRRNQKAMTARGATKPSDPYFVWMVLLHAGILIAAAVEVAVLHRPFYVGLAVPMAVLFLLANGVRWWVIRTLGTHWNVQVMDSGRLGVVTTGPFRFVRHPNYTAVFVELVALPLLHTAWLTALVGSMAHAWVLARRVALEDAVLLANPDYRAAMGYKPKFLPL